MDFSDVSICFGTADDDLTEADQLTGSSAEDFDQIRSEEGIATCSRSISYLAGTVNRVAVSLSQIIQCFNREVMTRCSRGMNSELFPLI